MTKVKLMIVIEGLASLAVKALTSNEVNELKKNSLKTMVRVRVVRTVIMSQSSRILMKKIPLNGKRYSWLPMLNYLLSISIELSFNCVYTDIKSFIVES